MNAQFDATVAEPRVGLSPLTVFLIALINAWIALAAYHYLMVKPQMTRLGAVDLPALYREKEAALTRNLAEQNDQERQVTLATAAQFAHRLQETLEQISHECQCTIVASNAIAGRHNVIDLTGLLRQRVGL